MGYFRVLLILTFLGSILLNKISVVDIVLQALSLILMWVITKRYSILEHIGKYVVLLTFWFSLIFMPSFHLVRIGVEYVMSHIDYNRILSFGSIVLLITCITWFVFCSQDNKKLIVKPQFKYKPVSLSKNVILVLFLVMFALGLFSFRGAIGRMGSGSVSFIPTQIAGIIILIRIVLFPTVFAIIIENFILRNKQIPKFFFALFLIWSLSEVFIRFSKGALINSLLMPGIILFVYYRPNVRTVLQYVTPIILLSLFLYPIVETMRGMEGSDIANDFIMANEAVQSNETKDNSILNPMNRTFMIPGRYVKDYDWVNHESLFDFSKAPLIMSLEGTPRYQTLIIDGYSSDIVHSSGTTALQDPLLFGGYGLCYIVVILLVLMAQFIDKTVDKRMYSIYFTWIIILWGFCNSQNISSLVSHTGRMYLFMRIFAIWLAYQLNFRRRINVQ